MPGSSPARLTGVSLPRHLRLPLGALCESNCSTSTVWVGHDHSNNTPFLETFFPTIHTSCPLSRRPIVATALFCLSRCPCLPTALSTRRCIVEPPCGPPHTALCIVVHDENPVSHAPLTNSPFIMSFRSLSSCGSVTFIAV